jgi:hypothetical protein
LDKVSQHIQWESNCKEKCYGWGHKSHAAPLDKLHIPAETRMARVSSGDIVFSLFDVFVDDKGVISSIDALTLRIL